MPITDFDFLPLHFDEQGSLPNHAELDALLQHSGAATDVIFIAHGFRTDEQGATSLYGNFLATFKKNAARPELQASLAPRKFVVAGIYWPSKPFQEAFPGADDGSVQGVDPSLAEMETAGAQMEALKQEVDAAGAASLTAAQALLPSLSNDPDAQDRFVAAVLSVLSGSHLDATEGLDRIRAQNGSDLLEKLKMPIILPTEPGTGGDSDGGGGVAAVGAAGVGGGSFDGGDVESIGSVIGSIFGAVGKFLNLTTWYIMKNRSGVVGANGVAQAVRALHAARPNVRIHLVGHSLGGRLMASCCKTLTGNPVVRPDSVSLLEAAFSHYGFSPNNGDGVPGFFRDVLDKHCVRGPLISTYSFQDTVVGAVYAIASRLADDNVKAIGDANDPFGGIGRNGAQRTPEAAFQKLKTAQSPGGAYSFGAGAVSCLDGSGGLIQDHGDVTNENVTYAFASAVAGT